MYNKTNIFDLEQIKKDYKNLSTGDLAEKYGISTPTMIVYLKKYNLYKPYKNRKFKKEKLNVDFLINIEEDYKTMLIDDLSKKYNVSYQTMQDFLKKYKIYKPYKNRFLITKGEKLIQDYLLNSKIEYIKQYIFEDCKNPKTNRKLPFDFYLPKYNICIEFDGKQHFIENGWFNNRNGALEEIQYRDSIKNEYCYNRSIFLIRIPYTKIENISCILNEIIIKNEKIRTTSNH